MAININKGYQWAINTCNAPNVGYSQQYREQQTVGGVTYYDCSSFIAYALRNAGFDVSKPSFTTHVMETVLTKLGFTKYNSADLVWKPFDILWVSGHTEMCYQGDTEKGKGVTMGAHTNGIPLADQVSINNSASTSSGFPVLYRYGDGGATGVGASIYVISALCGNAWRESNINPALNERGGGGFGLFQWTGGRKTALLEYLSSQGLSATDPNGQMQYLIEEDDWMGTSYGISSLDDFMTSTSTNIAQLTEAFCTCWERPRVPALNERIEHANQCYNYIQAHANDTSITTWVSEDRYLSESEILNNAVLLYRFYSVGGGGGGGSVYVYKSSFPLWMSIIGGGLYRRY